MKLDEKGRCCGRKPRTYRRHRSADYPAGHWCVRCSRSYSFVTGEQIENASWAFRDGRWWRREPRWNDAVWTDVLVDPDTGAEKEDGGSRTSSPLVECPECAVRLPAARHQKGIGMGVVPVHSPAPSRCSGSGNLVNVLPAGDENRPCSHCGRMEKDLEAVSGDEWLCQECYKALMSWMEQRLEKEDR